MTLFLRHLFFTQRGPNWGITVLSLFSRHKGQESWRHKALEFPVSQLPTWRELSDVFFEVITSSVFRSAEAFLACPLLLLKLTLRGEAPDYKGEDWRIFFRCDSSKRMFVEVGTWEKPPGQIPTKSTLTLKIRGKDYLNKVKWPWIWMPWKNLRHFPISLKKFDYFL